MAAIGLFGVLFRSYPLAMRHQELWRLAATLTYANAAGLLLAMCAPVVATAPLSPASRRVALFLVLTAMVATLSRGPMVALAVALPFIPRPALRAAAWPALLAAGAGALLLSTASGAGEVSDGVAGLSGDDSCCPAGAGGSAAAEFACAAAAATASPGGSC